MNENKVIENAVEYVRNELEGEGSGHDWWHIHRVTNLAEHIAIEEGANLFICKMAALLHDLADEKLIENEEIGLLKVQSWLKGQALQEEVIDEIMGIIKTISFKGGHGPKLSTLEAKVVQDADRLDAIGAIGVARCFTYAGSKGHLMYDPNIEPRESMTKEQYRNDDNTAINHFYEKLLKLKDLMNTATGRKLAIERHQFMERFLKQFYKEWDGEV
ncbi:HD domain-containing protein [Bacillaceae bacterium W0354]